MKQSPLTRILILCGLLVIIGLPCLWVYRQKRQHDFDRALIAAINAWDTNKAFALLQQGASPNTRETQDQPLSLWRLLQKLLNRPHRQSPLGMTALMLAIYHDTSSDHSARARLAITEAMLEYGADVNAEDQFGYTPLLTVFQGHWVPHTSFNMLPSEDFALVKCLLDHGANVNASNGETALMMASSCGYLDTVRYLLKKGANVNAVSSDSSPDTALGMAELSHDTAIIKLLKKAGAKG